MINYNEKGQAVAGKTVLMTNEDLQNNNELSVYWLGGGGACINAYGTSIMIDPMLEGFDMPLLYEMPITVDEIEHIDGILVSHVDNDHYSRMTLKDLKGKVGEVHSSYYVANLMKEELGVDGIGHTWHDHYQIKNVDVEVTPADHNWQNMFSKYQYRKWEKEEYSGFYLRVNGKKIWYVGDSRLMECQLQYEQPDVILFDFADNIFHIGLENAYRLANQYPDSILIPVHWGSVDAFDQTPFNGDPNNLIKNVINPDRIKVLAPGEKYIVE